MKKKPLKLYSLFLFPVYVLMFFVIGLALVEPMGKSQINDVSGFSPSFSRAAGQERSKNDCYLDGGTYISTGEDAYIVFDCRSGNIKAAKILFGANKTDKEVLLYYDIGEGFGEQRTVTLHPRRDNPYVFSLPGKTVRSIRLDFDKNLTVEGVDFYKDCVTTYEKKAVDMSARCVIAAVSAVLAVITLLIEGKTRALARLLSLIGGNIKPILKFIIGMTCVSILAVLATVAIRMIRGTVNLYIFVFVFAVIAVAFEICFFRNSAGKKTERLFLAICLTVGLMMIVITPIGHVSWDTDAHYRYALSTTAPVTVYSQADRDIMEIEEICWAKNGVDENHYRNIILNEHDNLLGGELEFDFNIAHFLSGVGIKLAKFFGFSFLIAYLCGKVPMLLVYAFVCFFAVKKLNSGKMILSVIALFPTSLFLATNYSYDYWVIAFSFLGLSYYYSAIQKPLVPVSGKETVIMCGALFLACIPKAIYLTLLFVPLFMPVKKIPNKVRYYLTCIAPFVFLAAMVFLRAQSSVSRGGDVRGGEDINSALQLNGILADPVSYAGVLSKFLSKYLSVGQMSSYISNMAYLGVGRYSSVFIALIILLGVIDKNEYDKESSKLIQKIIAVLFLVGTAAMIATVLYIDFTPVGYHTVNGCQQRYLTPLIFPACYLLGSFRKHIVFFEKHRAVVNCIAFSACSYALLGDIYLTILLKMV